MRVLIAEDDPVSRRVLQALLKKWDYDVTVACDGSEAWEILNDPDTPRLAILDWMMPGVDGADLCRRVRQRESPFYIYILLLTAKSQKDDLVEGLQAGADDYVTKPFHSGELEARLRSARRIIELEAALISTREELRDQAMRDNLTRLWNRGAILDALRNELIRSQREQRPLGLLIVDFDRFKRINDTCGHAAGDAVLRGGAERMQQAMRSYDLLGRYGGEEFLAVLPGCGPEETIRFGERLCKAVSGEPFRIDGQGLDVSVSVGGVSTDCPDPEQIDALVRTADAALYDAKDAGRNCMRLREAPVGEVVA